MGYALLMSASCMKARAKGLYTILEFTLGVICNPCPLHASNAERCAIIQSNLPSKWTVAKLVRGLFVEIKVVTGDVLDICTQY